MLNNQECLRCYGTTKGRKQGTTMVFGESAEKSDQTCPQTIFPYESRLRKLLPVLSKETWRPYKLLNSYYNISISICVQVKKAQGVCKA